MSGTLDDADLAYQPLDTSPVDTAITGVISFSLRSSARAGTASGCAVTSSRITTYNLCFNCRIVSSRTLISTNNHGSNELIDTNESKSNKLIDANESNESVDSNESNESPESSRDGGFESKKNMMN